MIQYLEVNQTEVIKRRSWISMFLHRPYPRETLDLGIRLMKMDIIWSVWSSYSSRKRWMIILTTLWALVITRHQIKLLPKEEVEPYPIIRTRVSDLRSSLKPHQRFWGLVATMYQRWFMLHYINSIRIIPLQCSLRQQKESTGQWKNKKSRNKLR